MMDPRLMKFLIQASEVALKNADKIYANYQAKLNELEKNINTSHKNIISVLRLKLDAAYDLFKTSNATVEDKKNFYYEIKQVSDEIIKREDEWCNRCEEQKKTTKKKAAIVASFLTGLPIFLLTMDKKQKDSDTKLVE